jgi:hypothetical protein
MIVSKVHFAPFASGPHGQGKHTTSYPAFVLRNPGAFTGMVNKRLKQGNPYL